MELLNTFRPLPPPPHRFGKVTSMVVRPLQVRPTAKTLHDREWSGANANDLFNYLRLLNENLASVDFVPILHDSLAMESNANEQYMPIYLHWRIQSSFFFWGGEGEQAGRLIGTSGVNGSGHDSPSPPPEK